MLKFQKATMIGLYAAMELARSYPDVTTAADIGGRFDASEHHLVKVLQQLSKAGLVEALRGVGGGYRLARPPKDVTLGDIVELFEGGPDKRRLCLFTGAPPNCPPAEVCAMHHVFVELGEQVAFTLRSISLKTLLSHSPTAT